MLESKKYEVGECKDMKLVWYKGPIYNQGRRSCDPKRETAENCSKIATFICWRGTSLRWRFLANIPHRGTDLSGISLFFILQWGFLGESLTAMSLVFRQDLRFLLFLHFLQTSLSFSTSMPFPWSSGPLLWLSGASRRFHSSYLHFAPPFPSLLQLST